MAKRKKKKDLRPVLKDAHAHFYLLKNGETIRLRLWEIAEDSLVIDRPEGTVTSWGEGVRPAGLDAPDDDRLAWERGMHRR